MTELNPTGFASSSVENSVMGVVELLGIALIDGVVVVVGDKLAAIELSSGRWRAGEVAIRRRKDGQQAPDSSQSPIIRVSVPASFSDASRSSF